MRRGERATVGKVRTEAVQVILTDHEDQSNPELCKGKSALAGFMV